MTDLQWFAFVYNCRRRPGRCCSGGRDAALAGPRHPPQAQHVLPGPLARCHAASLDPRDRGGPVTAEVAPGARFPARSTYYSL
jgi:hypothetical protein